MARAGISLSRQELYLGQRLCKLMEVSISIRRFIDSLQRISHASKRVLRLEWWNHVLLVVASGACGGRFLSEYERRFPRLKLRLRLQKRARNGRIAAH